MTVVPHMTISEESYRAVKNAADDFASLLQFLAAAREIANQLKLDELMIDLSYALADLTFAIRLRDKALHIEEEVA